MARGDKTHIAATAWHEAGHALAAMREGRVVIRVEIHPELPGSGVTVFLPFRQRNRFNPMHGAGAAKASWEDTLARKLAEARVALAGPLAEAKALNQPLRAIGASSDLARCQRIMDSLSHLRDYIALEAGNGAVSPVDLLNEQRTRVRQWLGRAPVWRAVGLIAEQLMSKTRIGSAEVLQAYLEARSADQQTLALGWDFSSPVRRRP